MFDVHQKRKTELIQIVKTKFGLIDNVTIMFWLWFVQVTVNK